MMARWVVAGMMLAPIAGPAIASEQLRYEPAPAWVKPAPAPAKVDDTGPLFMVLDSQTRIADGGSWSYREVATRALSADALARIGTVTLSWQPFHGDLVIHRVEILRDGQRIDALKAGQRFNVIRREQQLERLEMDGVLTATLPVEGLRVGDVLDVSYSITSKDPLLKGHAQASAPVPSEPFKVGFARTRFLWPAGAAVAWKIYPEGVHAAETETAGWHDLTLTLPAPKQPDLPNDAPPRFHHPSAMEVSGFAGWAAVSSVMAPLYATTGLIEPGGPLAAEVARIQAATPDRKARAAAALALVQDRIRYFAKGMDGGNYLPQAPAQTWSTGYGDCKAKTLLLLAMLRALDVEAEPVLASIGAGDLVSERLPAPAAFDHIFVHARVDGADLWLDGTGRGTRIDDLVDAPPLHWVLPVRAAGASLVKLPARAPARPTAIVSVDIDASAGIGLPAPFEGSATLRGAIADSLRVIAAQAGKEQLPALALATLGGAPGQAIPVTQKMTFDAAAGTATVTVTGITLPVWQREDHRYRLRLDSAISRERLAGDRSRPAWQAIPIATGTPGHALTTIRYRLPDGGDRFTVEGDAAADVDVAGHRLQRTARLAEGVLSVEDRVTSTGAELQPADVPAARAKLADAQSRLLRVATAPDYPALYARIEAAKRAHKLDRLAALYAAWIADKPDEAARYLTRAAFYERTFQRREALADLDKAVMLDGTAANHARRAALLAQMGEDGKAIADYEAALALEPDSKEGLVRLGLLRVEAGQTARALDSIAAHVANAGEDKPEWLDIKAQLLARAGDAPGALAALDEAIVAKPGSPGLLNERCWTKATLDVQLDTALKDCTRSIELSDSAAAALDSRALVYLRLKRLDEALADVDAALELRPGNASSLYLRGLIERRRGDPAHGDADLASARLIAPRIDKDYARYKIAA